MVVALGLISLISSKNTTPMPDSIRMVFESRIHLRKVSGALRAYVLNHIADGWDKTSHLRFTGWMRDLHKYVSTPLMDSTRFALSQSDARGSVLILDNQLNPAEKKRVVPRPAN